MIQVIGLNGKKRRGKDTVFTIMQTLMENDVLVREAFADRLKISFARLFLEPGDQDSPPYEGWSNADCIAFTDHFKDHGVIEIPEFHGGVMADGCDIDSWNISPTSGREALQKYGTEMHRDIFGEDFWVNQVLPPLLGGVQDRAQARSSLTAQHPGADFLVITDVRFPNEAERVRDYGGVVWEVVRPDLDAEDTDAHTSEVPLPRELVDATIINNGTLTDLDKKVATAILKTVNLN